MALHYVSGSFPQGFLSGITTKTSNFATASGTQVQVTGMSVSVAVPPSGVILVGLIGGYINNATNGCYCEIAIWDGTVGSGTQKAYTIHGGGTNVDTSPLNLMTIITGLTPGASKTYNVGMSQGGGGGTAQFFAAATAPVQLVVIGLGMS